MTDAATGKPVPDVVITARSPALQGEEMVVTDSAGTYRVGQLPPGTYELSLEKESYRPFKRADIVLRVDRTVRVNIQLQPEALKAEEIVVVGRPPTVDVGNTTTGVNVGKEFMNNVAFIQPNGSGIRSFESLSAVAPGVVADDTGYGFSGAQGAENLYIVDGVSVSDSAYGTNAAAFPVEFVEEANVITGGYQAEYGRATGGVLNVVTKSGSNEFHGSVWGDWTPGLLRGKTKEIPSDGSVFVGRGSATWNEIDFGADIGGPIIKDRLWFYVGFSPSFVRTKLDLTARHFLLNAAGDDFIYCSQQDVTDQKCSQDAYEQGYIKSEPLPGYHNEMFADVRAFSYIAKLTFLVNSDNNVSLSVIGSPQSSIVPTSFSVFSPRSDEMQTGYASNGNSSTVSLKYQGSFLDKRLLVDATLGWFHSGGGFDALDGSKFDYTQGVGATGTPAITIRRTAPYSLLDFENISPEAAALCEPAGGVPTEQVDVRTTPRYVMSCPVGAYAVGGAGFMEISSVDRYQGRVAVTYLLKALGHHIFKAGLDIQREGYDIQAAYSGGFAMASATNSTYYSDSRQFGYLTGPDQPVQQKFKHSITSSFGVGSYVQDSWSIMDLVTLNAGIRYETQQMFGADGNLGLTLNNMLAPRIGVIYDFTQQGRSKFFANFSRYYESVPMDMADRSLSGYDNQYAYYRNRTASTSATSPRKGCDPLKGVSQALDECQDPNNFRAINTYYGTLLGSPYGQYDVSTLITTTGVGKSPVDPNIIPQNTDEIVVGGEYEIIADGRVGATYTHRYMNAVIEDMSNDEGSTYFIGNPGFGLSSAFPKAVRDYDAVTAYFTKAFSDGWMAQASYTWSYLRGNYNGLYSPDYGQLDPNITADFDLVSLLKNTDGPLSGDRTHYVKVFASKEFQVTGSLAFVLGLTYTTRSGAPMSYLGANEGYGSDTVYVLPRGSAGRLPWIHNVSLKGGVSYRITKDNVASFTADVFNVLNLQEVTSRDTSLTYNYVLPFVVPKGQDPAASICIAGQAGPHCQFTDASAGVTNGVDADGDRVIPVKNTDGSYVKLTQVNPNFKRPTSFQAPISVRFGLKVTF